MLAVVCLSTGLTDIIIMDDISTGAVILALLTLQQVFGPISTILADQGTQYQLDVTGFHPKTNQQRKIFALLTEVKQTAVRGQVSNYVEVRLRQ